MKSNQIFMAGALALSMILSGCSATSTSEDVKDAKTTDTAKKADSKKSTKEDAKTSTKDKKESPKTETNKNTAEAVETKETSNSENKKVEVQTQNSQQHTHNWVAQYKTVNVPEQGHNEQVLVQAAYDEQVPITEMREYSICSTCGADITDNTSAHMKAHMLNGENGNFHSEWREVVTGYKTVHHDAVYETRYVVDSPATTKQELTGYKCSGCGKTKAN